MVRPVAVDTPLPEVGREAARGMRRARTVMAEPAPEVVEGKNFMVVEEVLREDRLEKRRFG